MKRWLVAMAAILALAGIVAGAMGEGKIDIDLSEVNDNLNYAQMKQVMADPQAYAGRTMCVRGKFSYSEATGRSMIVLCDASGCCEITLQFLLDGMTYPDDFPPLYTDVAVTGRLEVLDDAGEPWVHFEDARMTWDGAEG